MRHLFIITIAIFAITYCSTTAVRLQQDYIPPQASDNPKIFFKNYLYSSYIRSIPTYGRVIRLPWSGDYLPHRYGGTSARFGVMDTRYKQYPISINMYHQPGDYLANKGRPDFSDYVNKYYSPAEKYDLFVGDEKFTLTRTSKYYGARFNGGGDFASWMGMCHGLAPASYMVPTPNKAIIVLAADGITKIIFYPDDIKALATTWWAYVKFDNRLTGKRYSAINAGSFFLIFGNQIGRFRKNMAVEPFADAEIWNYAAIGYKASYYNINNGAEGSYSNTRITVNSAAGSFRIIGPALSAYVVGVKFRIDYASTINSKTISIGQPMVEKHFDYSMALYLDANDKIVGGVWTSNSKPSYAWGPDSIPESPFDKILPNFGGSAGSLSSIMNTIQQSSAQYMPMRSIVYYLARNSN